jgi:hypothetical protein
VEDQQLAAQAVVARVPLETLQAQQAMRILAAVVAAVETLVRQTLPEKPVVTAALV